MAITQYPLIPPHELFFMNAAGWAKHREHVELLARVPDLTHIVVGSITVKPREGNTGGTAFNVAHDGTSLNSLGLPNPGMAYYEDVLPEFVGLANECGKKLVVSIAGFSTEEYVLLAKVVVGSGADACEVNLGCPNVFVAGEQKPITSYDDALVQSALLAVREVLEKTGVELWVKLSPEQNPIRRIQIATWLGAIVADAAILTNTYPNVFLAEEDGSPLITVSNGIGGMAGTALKPIAMAMAQNIRPNVPKYTKLIGAGGVSVGADVRDYVRDAGCSGVAVGTAFFQNENPRIFGEILAEYADLFEAAQR